MAVPFCRAGRRTEPSFLGKRALFKCESQEAKARLDGPASIVDNEGSVSETPTSTAQSSLPAAPHGASLPPPTPDQADTAFASKLKEAGLLSELSDTLLMVLLERVDAKDDEDARRLDLLSLYYLGGDDDEVAKRRQGADRWFVHDERRPVNAHAIVRGLAALAPELGDVSLERIGTDDGPLVVRAGDHLSAVTDDEEEDEAEGYITVRGLVGALNVLLERNDVRERWVQLRGDGRREGFIAVGVTEAMLLCRYDCLEEDDPERLMEFGAW